MQSKNIFFNQKGYMFVSYFLHHYTDTYNTNIYFCNELKEKKCRMLFGFCPKILLIK